MGDGGVEGWRIGSDDEEEIAKSLQLIVERNVNAAVNMIFTVPRRPELAAAYFELCYEGLLADVFEGDFTFIVPWSEIGSVGTKSELRRAKEGFDAWYEKALAEAEDE